MNGTSSVVFTALKNEAGATVYQRNNPLKTAHGVFCGFCGSAPSKEKYVGVLQGSHLRIITAEGEIVLEKIWLFDQSQWYKPGRIKTYTEVNYVQRLRRSAAGCIAKHERKPKL